jgi:hypothetical protein
MDINSDKELENWSATVRKVDSSLHAAFARQERQAARKKPLWKRAGRNKDVPTANKRPPALQGGAV